MASADASKKKKTGADAKYFQTTKKGEIHDLKKDLNSLQKEKVKEAIKKVIAAMTVGKDVSTLFTDVVKSMQTENIELKKLIYLYIINYARSQPDKAILVVNTFQKDARDQNPLVRALAIRTMGCIRVDRITEYLSEPLKQALKDKNPYVRKTAAVCTAKLYDINPELVEEQDFLERLRDMLSDPNPMVVQNAVAALAEISETSGKDVFHINANTLLKLLAALNECTEWGQVFILDCLAQYAPNPKEAAQIIERVTPRLQHANSAVAMSAIKICMKYLDVLKDPRLEKELISKKLPPPLITLLSEQKPEIQYVALRNINLIVQKRPEILSKEVKHFFCKYNDPIYVKMEKLEIMNRLVAADNVEQVLLEFKEYATEVDVEFVRKSVRAIGRTAIKLEVAAERCIKVLLELIQTKVNYVVQEAIIVIKDIFRKYPNRYESIIATLCENLDTLDEPEAKASMIWIIGEYAARIENAPELLSTFVDSFGDETAQVQLQILTAVVKLFLKRPEDAKDMVTKVLNMATDNSDNPDLRDRGYVYWRLLSKDPEAAQQVVLAEKPVISEDTYQLDPSLLDTLIANISTLASIYHKPPESFVKGGKTFVFRASEEKAESDGESEGEEGGAEEEESSGDAANVGHTTNQTPTEEDEGARSSDEEKEEKEEEKPKQPAVIDFLGDLMMADTGLEDDTPKDVVNRHLVLAPEKGNGLGIHAATLRRDLQLIMDMEVTNSGATAVHSMAVKFNKNFFGLAPAGPVTIAGGVVEVGGRAKASFPIRGTLPMELTVKPGYLQIAIKTELGVAYFDDTVEVDKLFQEDGLLQKKEYLTLWKEIPEEVEQKAEFESQHDVDSIANALQKHNLFYVAKRHVENKGDVLYMSCRIRDTAVLLELTVGGSVRAVARCTDQNLAKAVLMGIRPLIQ